jgi:hypothetical protein
MEVVPMAACVRRFSTLTAVLAVAAVLGPAASARNSVLPTLYVAYTLNCTFGITDDSGKKVTSIAPGTYQVYVTTPQVFADIDLTGVTDMTACKSFVQFQLTGPGINAFTTLQDGDEDKDLLRETFQPSATYVLQDLNQAAVTRTTLTTTATGSPTAPSSSSTSSSSSSKGTPSTDITGSAVVQFRGTLAASVSAGGKLTFTFGGKAVTNLSAGRYAVKVLDRSTRAGFVLQRLNKTAITVTKPSFVGTHSVILTIKAGQWLYSSGSGKTTGFQVVG